MFGRHRKARVLFGLSDVLLAALAFEAAYQTRVLLHLERAFYLSVERKALVLAFALAAWVTIGLWLEVYEKLDIGNPRVILRDVARQCGYGALCLVVFEYVFRLDLSRFFLVLFSAYAGVGARDFDHGADHVLQVLQAGLAEHFLGNGDHDLLLILEFLDAADQRDHDFGDHLHALLGHLHDGFEDGARLHFGDLGIGDAETAAAMAQHGVELV